MAKTVESYGFAIVGQDTGKVYKKFNFEDVKEEIKQRLNLPYIRDEFTACALFNSSFSCEDELSQFFIDICIKRGIASTLAKREISVVKFFKRTKKIESSREDLNKNLVVWINPENAHLYSLPIVYQEDFADPTISNPNNSITVKDFSSPLYGLVKLGYNLSQNFVSERFMGKEEAHNKGLGELHDLYTSIEGLNSCKHFVELERKNGKLYRYFQKNPVIGVNLEELDRLYDEYDKIVPDNYLTKPTEEQIKIVIKIKRFYTKLLERKDTFAELYVTNCNKDINNFNEIFSYLNSLIKSGPYYYDRFDRELYDKSDTPKKMEIIYEFFRRLRNNGELSNLTISGVEISDNSNKYLLKLLDSIALVRENNNGQRTGDGIERTR